MRSSYLKLLAETFEMATKFLSVQTRNLQEYTKIERVHRRSYPCTVLVNMKSLKLITIHETFDENL